LENTSLSNAFVVAQAPTVEHQCQTKLVTGDTDKVCTTPKHWQSHWSQTSSTESRDKAWLQLAEERVSVTANGPISIRDLACPRWQARQHPAAPLLGKYARIRCPVSMGRDWTLVELDADAQ